MTTRRPRLAFTLLELLIAVAILAILVGMIGYGMVGVMNRSKGNTTHVTLVNLRGVLTEFKVVAKGLTRQPAYMYINGTKTLPNIPPAPQFDIWKDADQDTANPEPDAIPAPKNVKVDTAAASISTGDGRYSADGIANTQLVMGLLNQVPSVKSMFAQIPPSQFMEKIPTGLAVPKLTLDTQRNPTPPIVLDGWGNPILFVPSAGLYGVTQGDILHKPQRTTVPPAPDDGPIKSPDGTPFWVSAGPDGDFSKGDDNLYSFEN